MVVAYLHSLGLPLTCFASDPGSIIRQLPYDMPRSIIPPTVRGTTRGEVVPQRSLCSMHSYLPCREQPLACCIGGDDGVSPDGGGVGNNCIADCSPERVVATHAVDSNLFYKAVNEGLDIMGHGLMPTKPYKKV